MPIYVDASVTFYYTQSHPTSQTSTATSPGHASHDRYFQRHVCIAPGKGSTAFNTLPTSCSIWTFCFTHHCFYLVGATRYRTAGGRGLDAPNATVYAVQNLCVGVCVDVRKDREKSDGVSLHISKHEPRLVYSQHVDQM